MSPAPAGQAPFTDATERELLTSMAPEDMAKHLKLDGLMLDTNDSVWWNITKYITLAVPSAPARVYLGAVR